MKNLFVLSVIYTASLLSISATAEDDSLLRVFRYFNTVDSEYITVAAGEYTDAQITEWKWTDKSLLFFAFKEPGKDRVAVNSWYNPVTKDHTSIAADEFSDGQMMKMGYQQKHHQFYAMTRRGPNSVSVYRWRLSRHRDWITIQEQGDTNVWSQKGANHKRFQYFAVARNAY